MPEACRYLVGRGSGPSVSRAPGRPPAAQDPDCSTWTSPEPRAQAGCARTPEPRELCRNDSLGSPVTWLPLGEHGQARALTGASAGSSGPPSSAAPAAAESRSRGRRRPSSAGRPWPRRTAAAAGTARRAQRGLPVGGSRQGRCLRHRQRVSPMTLVKTHTAPCLRPGPSTLPTNAPNRSPEPGQAPCGRGQVHAGGFQAEGRAGLEESGGHELAPHARSVRHLCPPIPPGTGKPVRPGQFLSLLDQL